MTANQLCKALTHLGITQIALARKLETNERTVRYWMRGEWPVPVTVALLVNLMLDTKTQLDDLKA
jgi:transcriptional regulator with XRE-family HTH domain